eukprot:2893428-Ditylum_brightwellii.AAC.1
MEMRVRVIMSCNIQHIHPSSLYPSMAWRHERKGNEGFMMEVQGLLQHLKDDTEGGKETLHAMIPLLGKPREKKAIIGIWYFWQVSLPQASSHSSGQKKW